MIAALAELRGATVESIIRTVLANFLCLIQNDPWLAPARRRISQPL